MQIVLLLNGVRGTKSLSNGFEVFRGERSPTVVAVSAKNEEVL
jgi:hypothetical protein